MSENILNEQALKLWQSADKYLNEWNKFSLDGETTTYLLFSYVVMEKDLLSVKEFSVLSSQEEELLSELQDLIPKYVKHCALFKKMPPEKISKILKLLDTPSLNSKKIIALRKDVIRKEQERIDAKKGLIKDELKVLKKEKKEGSWLDL